MIWVSSGAEMQPAVQRRTSGSSFRSQLGSAARAAFFETKTAALAVDPGKAHLSGSFCLSRVGREVHFPDGGQRLL